MKIYRGRRAKRARTDGGCDVTITVDVIDGEKGSRLDCRNDLWNHSPDGPNWGYGGSGPAQLAVGILADLFPAHLTIHNYQAFKWAMIAPIRSDAWEITEDQVRTWMTNHGRLPRGNADC